jgi:hypothetical protein
MTATKSNTRNLRFFHIGLCATGEPINDMQRAFMALGDYRELHCGHRDVNAEAIRIAEEFRPDIVFIQVQTAGVIYPATTDRLRQLGAWVCNWTGDVRHPLPEWYIELGRHVDMTLFSNMTDVNQMQSLGLPCDFLQIGIDPYIFNPNGEAYPGMPPIVFFANNYSGAENFPLTEYRQQLVVEMKAAFGNQFGLYGNGWGHSDGNFNGDQRIEASAYRGAKIAINCSHFAYSRYSSDRLFRIMGSGIFCLTHQWPDMEQDFQEGNHFVSFINIPDLISKCRMYLDESFESKRAMIAKQGCEYTHKNFTFNNMARNLVRIYLKNKSNIKKQ